MKAFVTGGSGYVGRALITALVERGYNVQALARSERAAEQVRQAGATAISGDITAPQSLADALAGSEVVFHAAAGLSAMGDVAAQQQTTIGGTRNMLQASRQAGVARFVFISAASVIADGRPVVKADESRIIPAGVVGPYSRSKAEAEKLVIAANSPAMTTVAVRPPLIWGSTDQGTIPILAEMVRKGQFVWFNGGDYLYSVCHMNNVAEGAVLAGEKGRGGQVYFLTDGAPAPFRDLISQMLEAQGVTPNERNLPLWLVRRVAAGLETGSRLLGRKEVPAFNRETVALLGPFSVLDNKARQELGYRAAFSLAEGLAAMRRGLPARV